MLRKYRLNESILDDIEASGEGTSARKLADKISATDSEFNLDGNKRYRIGCPFMTTNDNFISHKNLICELYENFLEVLRRQHFTRDYAPRVIFSYNSGARYAAYCEDPVQFSKTVDMICAELHKNNYENIKIDYICDFNPVVECSRNRFLHDWILFKQAMYGKPQGIGFLSAYATTASGSNTIKIDLTESKVPKYIDIIDFYVWLFGEKGDHGQMSEMQYKSKYGRVCGPKLKFLYVMDWLDEHPDALRDWQLEVIGYTTPTNASNLRTFTFRLYPKGDYNPTFDDVFDFVSQNILGRMALSDIHSIFGEGAIKQYQDNVKVYIELPEEPIFEQYADGMKQSDFVRDFTVRGENLHTVPVQLLRVDDDDLPHIIGVNGEMLDMPWDKKNYEFMKVRYENIFRKDR